MRTLTALLVAFLLVPLPPVAAQVLAPGSQIEMAVTPLPPDMRADAGVLGFTEAGELTMLREASNGMICVANDPTDDRFHVACYHESLEPFMTRGRELRAQGHESDAVIEMRRSEIEDGSLAFPEGPAALYSLTGDADSIVLEDGELHGATRLHVVYLPYATLEGTGLPARAPRGQPWLMDPGEPWAHIMLVQVDTP